MSRNSFKTPDEESANPGASPRPFQEEITYDNLSYRWNRTRGLAAFAAVRRCRRGLPCARTAGQGSSGRSYARGRRSSRSGFVEASCRPDPASSMESGRFLSNQGREHHETHHNESFRLGRHVAARPPGLCRSGIRGCFTFKDTVQTFIAPVGGTYTITAFGAAGGDSRGGVGGKGAEIGGDFVLTPGEILDIYVGGQGGDDIDRTSGGGTFVIDPHNNPLVVAGGGFTGNEADGLGRRAFSG
jgi:hypothetical protein